MISYVDIYVYIRLPYTLHSLPKKLTTHLNLDCVNLCNVNISQMLLVWNMYHYLPTFAQEIAQMWVHIPYYPILTGVLPHPLMQDFAGPCPRFAIMSNDSLELLAGRIVRRLEGEKEAIM